MNERGPKALTSALIPKKENWHLFTWKCLLVKTKAKIILQYYDNLVACFNNKLNFMQCRSSYLKIFDKKLSLMSFANCQTPIFI